MRSETLDECLKVAHARLYPSLFNPNYLVLRRRRELFTKWLSNLPGSGLKVLDIGGRYQPYRPLLEDKIKSYVAIDLLKTPLVDVMARGEFLPFAAEAFDLVIATQVFDYFEQPHLASVEVHRVLRRGGHLLMSVPSVAPRFASEERWRYLPAGLRVLLANFSSVEIVPETGSMGGLFRTLSLYVDMFARPQFLRGMLTHTLIPVLNLAGWRLENWIPSRNDQFAANYSVLATK